jgi:2'-aminobiphenyl-2,3-diol 1,2-dioxygenase, large subunit
MGQLVGAFATSHVLLGRSGVEAQADRVFDGMLEIRRRVDALDPEIVVLVGDDHFANFDLAYEIPLGIPVQKVMTPIGDAGLPVTPFFGNPEFSGGLVDYVSSNGFDVTILREYKPCHGFTIPAYFTAPRKTRLIAPVVTNTMMDPPLRPSRCYELGKRIGEYIRNVRRAAERCVIVGTGGLSHWVGIEPPGPMSFEFDQLVFDSFAQGKAEELAQLSAEEIIRRSGNGGLEIVNWLIMAGAVHGKAGQKVYYEPIPQWFTGMAGIQMAL